MNPDIPAVTSMAWRPSGILVVLALSLIAPFAAASELQITLASVSSPVAPFGTAALEIQTEPGAACEIEVIYRSGPSRARGLVPQTASASGRVTWRWVVGSNTTPGGWPIVVTCERGRDLGRLKTSFEVR